LGNGISVDVLTDGIIPKLKYNKRKGLSHKKWYDCDLKKQRKELDRKGALQCIIYLSF
jgi:hypothetical protein